MRVLLRGKQRVPGLGSPVCLCPFIPGSQELPEDPAIFLLMNQEPSRAPPRHRGPQRPPAQPHLEAQHLLALPEQRQLLPGERSAGAGRMQGPLGRVRQHRVLTPLPEGRHRSRPPPAQTHSPSRRVSLSRRHRAAGCERQTD